MSYHYEYEARAHRNGTKEYYVFRFTHSESNRSLFVTSWGKRGRKTVFARTEAFNSREKARKAYLEKLNEKDERGYAVCLDHGSGSYTSEDNIRAVMANHKILSKMTAENLAWLTDGTPRTAGGTPLTPAEDSDEFAPITEEAFDDLLTKGRIDRSKTEAIKRLKEPAPEPVNPYSDDPTWGMF